MRMVNLGAVGKTCAILQRTNSNFLIIKADVMPSQTINEDPHKL